MQHIYCVFFTTVNLITEMSYVLQFDTILRLIGLAWVQRPKMNEWRISLDKGRFIPLTLMIGFKLNGYFVRRSYPTSACFTSEEDIYLSIGRTKRWMEILKKRIICFHFFLFFENWEWERSFKVQKTASQKSVCEIWILLL